MKTLHWRHTDWTTRKFAFFLGQQVVGQLNFNSAWNFNGMYTDKESRLHFKEGGGFFNRSVSVSQGAQIIGHLKYNLIGKQKLQLTSGETYLLTSNVWGRDVKWRGTSNNVIMKYDQASMNSMGKGTITLEEPVSPLTEKILMAAGLYIRHLITRRIALLTLLLIPILAASRN